ncbi:MAG: PorT family protein [Bacteroidia bacterium]|nr:PorT family protein [Bacteroidia bacterium]MBT8267791.1 PorT family protein [Bacteroidia bacterium]
MKKIMLMLVLSSMFLNELVAQDLTFGAKAGVNLSTLTNNDDYDSRYGIHFGAVAEWEISDKFSLQPELLYSGQGYKRDLEGRTLRGKIDYLNIPLMASVEVMNDVSLMAGPQIGINLRAELDGEGQEIQRLTVNDVDASVVFGIQIDVDASFFIQGRYALGLSEVRINQEEKHSVFSVSMGFYFD